jgi:hypothetical protein
MKSFIFKLLGPFLAIAGVLGLTGSSILWNFQGRGLGLPATIASLLTLAVGVVLLRPLPSGTTPTGSDTTKLETEDRQPPKVSPESDISQNNSSDSINLHEETPNKASTDPLLAKKPSLTTAEAIAAELSAEQAKQEKVILINYAPKALSPATALKSKKRSPGNSLSGFREMASDLFKTN